jgi:hypothetical protein
MKFTTATLATLTLALAFAGGCATTDPDAAHREEEKCGEVKPGTITSVNKMCAVMTQDPVNPALETAEWKGQKVGFCCKGCVPRWNKMSPEQKDAALAAAMATK